MIRIFKKILMIQQLDNHIEKKTCLSVTLHDLYWIEHRQADRVSRRRRKHDRRRSGHKQRRRVRHHRLHRARPVPGARVCPALRRRCQRVRVSDPHRPTCIRQNVSHVAASVKAASGALEACTQALANAICADPAQGATLTATAATR